MLCNSVKILIFIIVKKKQHLNIMIFQRNIKLDMGIWNILYKKILVYRIIKYNFLDQWISILCLQYPIMTL